MTKLVTRHGLPLDQVLQKIASELKKELETNSGKEMQQALLDETKSHIQQAHPGSQHWDPSKVTEGEVKSSSASIEVNIPGASRFLHDIDIFPKRAAHLAIPMHKDAYRKSPRQVPGLFYVKKKNGSEFLARHNGGSIQMMYFLAKHVHQKQDKSLLPSPDTLADKIFQMISAMLDRKVQSVVKSL